MTKARQAQILVLLIALLAACGGTGGGDTTPSTMNSNDTASTATSGTSATTATTVSTSDGDLPKVTVAVLGPGSLQWLHAVARDQGFYAEHGVEVEDVQVQNSSALVQAVASGSANAGIALGDNVIRAVDDGAPVIIVGGLIQKTALRLYGAPGVTCPVDVEGTQVTAGAVEGGTYDLMLYMLQQEGVDTSTLTPVAIANSRDRVVAMENGQVQGALLIPPFDTIAEEAGAVFLGWLDEYWLETPAIVNTDWAQENPEAAAGWTRGLAEAARFFADPANKDAVVASLVAYTNVEEHVAEAAYDFIHPNEVFSPDLSVPPESLTNIVRFGTDVRGEEMGDFDPEKYLDLSYLE